MRRRGKDDPRVALVTSALERSLAHPNREHDLVSLTLAALLLYTTPGVLTTDEVTERFIGWPADDVRALVLAFALHCPEAELEQMAERARDELVFLEDMERDVARGAA